MSDIFGPSSARIDVLNGRQSRVNETDGFSGFNVDSTLYRVYSLSLSLSFLGWLLFAEVVVNRGRKVVPRDIRIVRLCESQVLSTFIAKYVLRPFQRRAAEMINDKLAGGFYSRLSLSFSLGGYDGDGDGSGPATSIELFKFGL